MKKLTGIALLFTGIGLHAQDSTEKKPAEIFSNERAILSNTTQTVGKGKMKFNVTHYFDDIGGSNGGLKNFFGLDNSTDVRIAFIIGLGKRLDATIARAKGGPGPIAQIRVEKNYELALKYKLLEQIENDPSHPLSLALFFSNIISTQDTAKAPFMKFQDFGDRMSQTFQLMVAKKWGRVSVQINPTLTIQGYTPSYDLQRSMFALGGVVRFPAGRRVNIIIDYLHPFRNDESKQQFINSHNLRFKDPLGIGVEILTSGHVFTLNFTNATQIQEARFIPYTTKTWGDGEFRWGFTVSRKFTLWRDKK